MRENLSSRIKIKKGTNGVAKLIFCNPGFHCSVLMNTKKHTHSNTNQNGATALCSPFIIELVTVLLALL